MNQDNEYLFVCGVREVGDDNSGPLWLGYCPALGLSASGKTADEARQAIREKVANAVKSAGGSAGVTELAQSSFDEIRFVDGGLFFALVSSDGSASRDEATMGIGKATAHLVEMLAAAHDGLRRAERHGDKVSGAYHHANYDALNIAIAVLMKEARS
jgi:hypothetical protein